VPIDRDGSACPRSRPIVARHPPPGSSIAVTAPPPSRGWPPAHWPASIISFNTSDCSLVRPSPGFRPAAASLVGPGPRPRQGGLGGVPPVVAPPRSPLAPRRLRPDASVPHSTQDASSPGPVNVTPFGHGPPKDTLRRLGLEQVTPRLVPTLVAHAFASRLRWSCRTERRPGCMATHRPHAAVGAVRTEAVPTASTARSGPRRVCLTAGFGRFRLPELCQPRAGPKGGAQAGNRSDRRDPVGHGPQGAG
jgi:hypothetical protein